MKFSEGAPAWDSLLQCLPTVRDQFAAAVADRPFTFAPRLAFRSGVVAGRRWALLPSAAGFVDPLLSTGFPLALLGVTRLAAIMEQHWDSDRFAAELAAYARQTDDELLAVRAPDRKPLREHGQFSALRFLVAALFRDRQFRRSRAPLG